MHDPSASREPRRHVEDPVAEVGDLTAGQLDVVGKADELRPCDEVGRGEHALEPGLVLRRILAGQVAEPGRLGLADAVLDTGVAAVADLEYGNRGRVAATPFARSPATPSAGGGRAAS